MARKIINRKELRKESEAAEKIEAADKAEAKVKKKKVVRKRKSRAKTVKEVRYKAYWGVFNQSLKRVAMFEYHERKDAKKRAEELSAKQKSPHFIRPVKEEIEEE